MPLRHIYAVIRHHIGRSRRTVVAVGGGSGAGKTTLARKIAARFPVVIISMDDYYKGSRNPTATNFDVPDALDLPLLARHLRLLKAGKAISKPIYDMRTHRRSRHERIDAKPVIIVEGIFALHATIRKAADIAIFVDSTLRQRWQRRLRRDVRERGRTPSDVRRQFFTQVEPAYVRWVEPTARFATLTMKT